MRLRYVLAAIATVIIGAGAALGVYAYEHGFTKKWRRLIMNEFEKHGIIADLDKLTIDPFEGLVARNVRIYQDEDRKILFASVNNITLDVDLARLIREEQFLNTVDLRDASISLPVDLEDPNSERLEISNFSARIELPEDKIEITEARFEVNNVLITITGSLLQPPKTGKTEAEKEERRERNQRRLQAIRERRHLLQRIDQEIEKFHFDKNHKPQLNLAVYGDLGDPRNLEARLRVRATNVGRKNFYADRLEAQLHYDYPYVRLDQFLIKDEKGELHASASHQLGTESVTFGLESSIDAHAFLRSLVDTKALGEIIFFTPPKVHVDGEYFLTMPEGKTGLPLKIIGGANFGQFTARGGAIFEGFQADFCIEHDKKFFRNIVVEHNTGTLSGQFLVEGDQIRYKGDLDMDPTVFIPMLKREETRRFYRRFDFGNSPTVSVQFEGSGPVSEPTKLHTTGRLALGPCKFNGIEAEAAIAQFEIKNRDHIFHEFRLERKEGHVTGDFASYDYPTKKVVLENVRGRVWPAPTTAYFAPKFAKHLERYKFSSPPHLVINGTIDAVGRRDTDLDVEFNCPDNGYYPVLKKTLTLSNPRGTVHIAHRKVDVDLQAGLMGGSGRFQGNFNIDRNDKSYAAQLNVDKASFAKLAETYDFETQTQGEITGHFNFTSTGIPGESLTGEGAATIANGNIFAIPVLGPLSKLIDALLPRAKAGYSVAQEATAQFKMSDHKVYTKNFEATTPAFILRGKGSVNTQTKDLNFDAEMNFRRPVASIVFFPISKLLKYKGEGTLDKPHWRPINFSLPRRAADPDAKGPGVPVEQTSSPQPSDGRETDDPGGRRKDRPRILPMIKEIIPIPIPEILPRIREGDDDKDEDDDD